MKLFILSTFLILTTQSLKAGDDNDLFNTLVINPMRESNQITREQAVEWGEEVKVVREGLFDGEPSNEDIEKFWALVDKISPNSDHH